jgi:hypothetical protein
MLAAVKDWMTNVHDCGTLSQINSPKNTPSPYFNPTTATLCGLNQQ